MRPMASQITSLTVVYTTLYSEEDKRKHQSSASLAFVWGIHRWPVNSPHKWSVRWRMLPFDDVIMYVSHRRILNSLNLECWSVYMRLRYVIQWYTIPWATKTLVIVRKVFNPNLQISFMCITYCIWDNITSFHTLQKKNLCINHLSLHSPIGAIMCWIDWYWWSLSQFVCRLTPTHSLLPTTRSLQPREPSKIDLELADIIIYLLKYFEY